MKLKPIEKYSIPKQIVEYIFNLIVQKKLEINDRLPSEREIARNLSISRTSLREGMSILKLIGIIEIKNGIPYISMNSQRIFHEPIRFHLSLMKDNYLEIIEMRKFLEMAIAVFAAKRATIEDIHLLETLCKEMRENCHNLDKYIENNINFHIYLAKATQNILILDIYDSLREVLSQYQHEIIFEEDTVQASLNHHVQILDAIKEKNKRNAVKIMEEHIKLSEEAFRKYCKLKNLPLDNSKENLHNHEGKTYTTNIMNI